MILLWLALRTFRVVAQSTARRWQWARAGCYIRSVRPVAGTVAFATFVAGQCLVPASAATPSAVIANSLLAGNLTTAADLPGDAKSRRASESAANPVTPAGQDLEHIAKALLREVCLAIADESGTSTHPTAASLHVAEQLLAAQPWASTSPEYSTRQLRQGELHQWQLDTPRHQLTLNLIPRSGLQRNGNSAAAAPAAAFDTRLRLVPLGLNREAATALQLLADDDCSVRSVQRLVYALDGTPQQLEHEDAAGAALVPPLDFNPPVPAGVATPAAAIRVSLVDSGVNYLLPSIHRRLARNADGELIGYDFWDDDARPFDIHPSRSPFVISHHGTRTASLLLQEAPDVALVPYRYPRHAMHRMADLIAHASANHVRVIGIAMGSNDDTPWQVFEQAAAAHPELLFVISAGNNGRNIDQQPVYPAALTLPNAIVVTSADDTARPARGSNWGRIGVDYLLPAEQVTVTGFDGQQRRVSGSSYAVPRMVGLLARLLQRHPQWRAEKLISELRRRFADGGSSRYASGGYIGDPLSLDAVTVRRERQWQPDAEQLSSTLSATWEPLRFSPAVIVTTPLWVSDRIDTALGAMAVILAQCGIVTTELAVLEMDVPGHLRVMSIGGGRTLVDSLLAAGYLTRPRLFLMQDTRYLFEADGSVYQHDAEAFGTGNTRSRRWLENSVWVAPRFRKPGLVLAHETMHVLMNSGEHTSDPGNLMHASIAQSDVAITDAQCQQARDNGKRAGMLR